MWGALLVDTLKANYTAFLAKTKGQTWQKQAMLAPASFTERAQNGSADAGQSSWLLDCHTEHNNGARPITNLTPLAPSRKPPQNRLNNNHTDCILLQNLNQTT